MWYDTQVTIQKEGNSMNFTFSRTDIAKGVDVCAVRVAGFKTASVSFTFAVNLSELNGVNALASKLLQRSSEDYADFLQISRRLAELYGASLSSSVTRIGEQQVIRIAVSFIGDRFALSQESIAAACSDLLLNLIFKPNIKNGAFPTDETESEKRLLCEQIDGEKNDKAVYARGRLEQVMCAGEPYALNKYGDKERIKTITPEKAAEGYRAFLKTALIRINFVGDMDFDRVLDTLKARISEVERAPAPTSTTFIRAAGTPRYASEDDTVNQGKLVLGFRAGMDDADDRYYARRVFADLFGGSPHSKLFKNVREKMSLCYYCSAQLIAKKGIMLVQSGIETDNEEKAKTAILAQLQDMQNGNFSDEDLKASIDYLTDAFAGISDTPEGLDSWFSEQITASDIKMPEEYIENFKKVTRQNIIDAANGVTLDTVFMLRGVPDGEGQKNA